MLEKVQHEDVGVEVIQKGLGNVNEGDVTRAENSPPAVVYSFNVVVTPQAALLARDKKVELGEYKIIYELFDDVIRRLNILVPPEVIVTPLGNFETVAIFRTEQGRMVVGGKVTDGKVVAGEKAKVWRHTPESGQTAWEPIGLGTVDSVQTGKQTVKEAHGGQECGVSFTGKVKIQIGDRLEIYHEETKERKIVLQR
jgi:translation initiation factor IF-2